MSTETSERLWKESKAELRAAVEAREKEFQKNFEKKWYLCRPLFYKLLSFVIPSLHRRFVAERNTIRAAAKKIMAEYALQVRAEITQWQDGFNQWEEENSGPSLCGSGSAIRKERKGRDNAIRLSAEMITMVTAIPRYDWHYHPIEDPTDMVENSYPGYLTSERARNYCEYLLQAFS